MNVEQAIKILSDKVRYLDEQAKKEKRQRRHEINDSVGSEHIGFGDSNNPVTIYFSISNDLTYYLRHEWRLIFRPFYSTVATNTSDTDLSISQDGKSIIPNPHNHELKLQITKSTAKPSGIRIEYEGIDITNQLLSQFPSMSFDDFKVYPSDDDSLRGFDILKVVESLSESQRSKIEEPGFKTLKVYSDVPIFVSLVLYLKHSNVGR